MAYGWYDTLYGAPAMGPIPYGHPWPYWGYGYGGAMMSPYGYAPSYDPAIGYASMVKDEVNHAYKNLDYIKALEAKLKGSKPGDRDTNLLDWEMLGNMKKDLG